jgi:hypothetical protein
MKILKKEWFIWKFWKKGGGSSREKGEEETKSMPHAPVVGIISRGLIKHTLIIKVKYFQKNTVSIVTVVDNLHILYLFTFHCASWPIFTTLLLGNGNSKMAPFWHQNLQIAFLICLNLIVVLIKVKVNRFSHPLDKVVR